MPVRYGSLHIWIIRKLIGLALHEMGDESIAGIVDLMTGEKDPRNLMLVFSILKVVMVEWDVTNHAEVCCFNTLP